MIEGYTRDRDRLESEWNSFEAIIADLDAPYFHTAGNHDIGNHVMLDVWNERFGASYYHFVYKDVLFLVLNSELFDRVPAGRKHFATEDEQTAQMAYIEATLKANDDVRWTFVFTHQPYWELSIYEEENPDWEKVETLLKGRPHTVFGGHLHRYNLQKEHGHNRITLATTGGGSALRGIEFGEFDQVAWVTMTNEGPVVANIGIDSIVPVDLPVQQNLEQIDALRGMIQPEPMLTASNVFSGGIQTIRLENTSIRPVRISGEFVPSIHLSSDTRFIDIELAPGELKLIDLPLTVKTPAPVDRLAPMISQWFIQTADPEKELFTARREIALFPRKLSKVTQQIVPVAIDGSLNEWGDLRFSAAHPAEVAGPGTHRGPADASYTFDIRQDETNIYIAVEVSDDAAGLSHDLLPYVQDCIVLHIDFRDEPERSDNKILPLEFRSQSFRRTILASVAPSMETGGWRRGFRENLWPESFEVQMIRTETGYALEALVPHALAKELANGEWHEFRFNIGIGDRDPGEKMSELYWRPNRFGQYALKGTGMFSRR